MPEPPRRWMRCVVCTALVSLLPAYCCAYTPSSPEVRAMIEKGQKFLESKNDKRLGGKCVVALAFLKDPLNPDYKDHPRVHEALEACRQSMKDGDQGGTKDIYSCGMAIIFLCSYESKHSSKDTSEMITHYMGALARRQKPIGAFGYSFERIGDNSQTQYGALAMWEAHQTGHSPTQTAVKNMAHWLVRVQDPTGGFSYKGEEGSIGKRVDQNHSEMTLSIGSAAMGSVLIAADLFGLLKPKKSANDEASRSHVLREKGESKPRVRPLGTSGVDKAALMKAIRDGDKWMIDNYKVSQDEFQHYYMYSLERYKSFAEKLEANPSDEPAWYNKGVDYLKKTMNKNGSWEGGCGAEVDTGFAILFLLRSTKLSISQSRLGTLLSGRGLPSNLNAWQVTSRGELITKRTQSDVNQMLALLGGEDSKRIEEMVNSTIVGKITKEDAPRFQQIARSGIPAARILAVRALGRGDNLDYVPTLIFGLTDPDRRVVIEARDGLRRISRRFNGFGLTEKFSDGERRAVIEKWKDWYLAVRPDAAITLN